MIKLFKNSIFNTYIMIVLLNAMTDLGHKIILQNTIFKSYDGSELIFLTALVNALILLPFIFLFTPSGYISDRYPKTKVISYASAFAVFITIMITISYYMGWFWFAFGMTFVLAAQSAIYSPAKYGLIKELFGDEKLTEANAIVQAVTIVAILAGAVVYSIFFEKLLQDSSNTPSQILSIIAPVGFLLVGASLLEFLLAKSLAKKAKLPQNTQTTYTPLKKSFIMMTSKKDIFLSIIALSIIWGISQVVVAVFGEYLKETLGITNTIIAQALLSLSGVGIIFGSLVAGKVSKNYIELGTVPLGAIGVAITLFLLPNLTNTISLGIDLFVFGFFAGLFIVPLNALIQFATPKKHLGTILAGNNYMQNIFMFVFLVATAFASYLKLSSTLLLYIVATIAFLGMGWTILKLPQTLVRYIVKSIVALRYKVSVYGLENIDVGDKGVLLLGNHISFLDWAILQIAYPTQIRFVIDRGYYDRWYFRGFLNFFKVIPISPRGSKTALVEITKALKNGDTVALFPEGHLTRNGHLSEFRKGFEIACEDLSEDDAVIVPFYLRGLWEGRYSHASQKLKQESNKDISVTFGKPMSIHSKATQVKKAVFELSVISFENYIKTLPPLQKAWIKTAKKVGSSLAIADSTGLSLSGYKFATATIMIAQKLKPKLQNQTNIGIVMPTGVGGSMVHLSVMSLAKVAVHLNYSASKQSLAYAVQNANLKTIITSKQFITKLKAKGFDISEILEMVEVIYVEDIKKDISKLKSLLYFIMIRFLPTSLVSVLFIKNSKVSDIATILFSSGSEGLPKGIELTHQNILGNIKQFKTVINPTKDDVILGTLPIFHSFGLTVTTLFPLIEGVKVACHVDPTDGYGIGKIALKHKATILCATATFFRLYTKNRKLHPLMFETLRYVVAGAEKLPNSIADDFKAKFSKQILEGYGTTETSPVVSCNIPDIMMSDDYRVQIGTKIGSIGMPIPGTAIRITDPQTFEELEVGEEGMILVGGVQVLNSYLNDPQKTDEVLKEIDGIRWYVTGDKGKVDEDGFVTIVDRYSRFAKIGGEMVSLGLVESEILKIVDENSHIAITAIPDEKKGEKLVLLLEGEMQIEELKQRIKNLELNPLFLPSKYIKVDTIPKLGSGKADFKGIKRVAMV